VTAITTPIASSVLKGLGGAAGSFIAARPSAATP